LQASICRFRGREAFCRAKNRAIESSSQYHSATIQGNSRGELTAPSTAADRPGQWHRALYEISATPARTDVADHGLGAQMIIGMTSFAGSLRPRISRDRFDNRDIGKSSRMTGGKRWARRTAQAAVLKIPVAAPYTLRDMAEDTVGYGCARHQSAHLVGASMGRHDRPGDRDFVSAAGTPLTSSCRQPAIQKCSADARSLRHADGAAAGHQEEYFERYAPDLEILRVGSFRRTKPSIAPAPNALRARFSSRRRRRQFARSSPQANRKQRLASVKAPTLVIHGTVDPPVRPEAARTPPPRSCARL